MTFETWWEELITEDDTSENQKKYVLPFLQPAMKFGYDGGVKEERNRCHELAERILSLAKNTEWNKAEELLHQIAYPT